MADTANQQSQHVTDHCHHQYSPQVVVICSGHMLSSPIDSRPSWSYASSPVTLCFDFTAVFAFAKAHLWVSNTEKRCLCDSRSHVPPELGNFCLVQYVRGRTEFFQHIFHMYIFWLILTWLNCVNSVRCPKWQRSSLQTTILSHFSSIFWPGRHQQAATIWVHVDNSIACRARVSILFALKQLSLVAKCKISHSGVRPRHPRSCQAWGWYWKFQPSDGAMSVRHYLQHHCHIQ